jgi:hypothetical protein
VQVTDPDDPTDGPTNGRTFHHNQTIRPAFGIELDSARSRLLRRSSTTRDATTFSSRPAVWRCSRAGTESPPRTRTAWWLAALLGSWVGARAAHVLRPTDLRSVLDLRTHPEIGERVNAVLDVGGRPGIAAGERRGRSQHGPDGIPIERRRRGHVAGPLEPLPSECFVSSECWRRGHVDDAPDAANTPTELSLWSWSRRRLGRRMGPPRPRTWRRSPAWRAPSRRWRRRPGPRPGCSR